MLIFQPEGKRTQAVEGKTILDAAKDLGVQIQSICGGRGTCGKCRVIIRDGRENLSKPSESELRFLSEEELDEGFRLACQAIILRGRKIVVEIPPESGLNRQRLLLKGVERSIALKPAVRRITIRLKEPTLTDQESDVDRLLDAIESKVGFRPTISYEALRNIPRVLREGEWVITAILWMNREVIAVYPGVRDKPPYGVAVDIGTTKLALYLLDLDDGRVLASASTMNPQIPYGEDVISRILYIMEGEENLERLHNVVVGAVNELIDEVCSKVGIKPSDIHDMTAVGNTAMHHIFLNVTPKYVSLSPYPAVLHSSVDVRAKDLGVKMNRGAYVHVLPTIAGFVGADAIADIIATGLHEMEDYAMVIDIGTNTEIALGNKDQIMACSCASGPAFEGAHITHGMRAATGAIERIWINPETLDVTYKTIGDVKPSGLCGSAVIDAVAEMLRTGIIGWNGSFNPDVDTPRLRRREGAPYKEFVIAWGDETATGKDIVVTQNDIREIQLAKAAVYTGISILMRHMNLKPLDIKRIFIAGAFGNYIDPQSARMIGMYPDVPLNRVKFVGNTAGSGARMALLSTDVRALAESLSERVEYVELGVDPDFQDEFVKAIHLPHRERERFPTLMRIIGK